MLHFFKNFSAYSGKNTLTTLLKNGQRTSHKNTIRNHSGSMKVTVIGAAGKIGRPLSLLLKQSPLIDELSLYDIKPTCNFALELGHIDTKSKVAAYTGKEGLEPALKHAKIVVCVAQKHKANSMNYVDALEVNGKIIKEITYSFARHSPKAIFAIATQPINSLVPMISEELKRYGKYQPSAIMGISTLHAVRTNTFVAEILGIEPECVVVPVIGGNTSTTIVPVLSKAKPCAEFTREELVRITKAVQRADEDMMKVRTVRGATLSAAFAIARFVISAVKGVRGYKNIVEYAYVLGTAKDQQSSKYLTTPVQLGPDGVQKNFGKPSSMTDYEKCLFDNALTHLEEHIKGGELLAGVVEPPPCDPCDPDIRAPPCPPDWCELKFGKKKHST